MCRTSGGFPGPGGDRRADGHDGHVTLTKPALTVPLSTATGTVQGARTRNNDRVFASPDAIVVVDGAGEDAVAGIVATAGLAGAVLTLSGERGSNPRALVDGAADAVTRVSAARGSATITALTVTGGAHLAAHLAWLGDSPAFVLRAGMLQQLTRPHNRAQELAEKDLLSFDEVQDSPLSSLLTRGIGTVSGTTETLSITLSPGDRILVASDGVLAIPLGRLGWALSQGDDARGAVDAILDAAVDHGADDNVSIGVMVIDPPRDLASGTVVMAAVDTAGHEPTIGLAAESLVDARPEHVSSRGWWRRDRRHCPGPASDDDNNETGPLPDL